MSTRKLSERIQQDGITLEVDLVDEIRSGDWHHRHYEATLHRGEKSMTVEGGYQAGMRCGWPTAVDVLAVLLSVAVRVDDSADYLEWARESTDDPEEFQPRSVYEASKKATRALRDLIGADQWEAYLYETEHDD